MNKAVRIMGICTLFFILAMGGMKGMPPAFAGAVLDIDGNGTVDGGTDALLVNRYVFGFRGTSLTSGAVGSGCTRCTAAAIEAYLATLIDSGGGDTYTNSLGMTFKRIPAGTFTMGSPATEPGRSSNETQHQVTLTQDFYMMTTEVTQGQWQAVMGSNPSYHVNCGSNCPVEMVSWDDIQTFITAMNASEEGTYRLPTEAEWEYAARAGSTTAFSNGALIVDPNSCELDPNLDLMGWYCGNSNYAPHPVAQKKSNRWGIFDMHGNVWEFVNDWYGDYPMSSVTDPVGLSVGSRRVIRGGGYDDIVSRSRSAYRFKYPPYLQSGGISFRLVFSPNP